MKTALPISLLALAISITSLTITLSNRSEVDAARMDHAVDRAILKREKDLVYKLRPDFRKMFTDMNLENYGSQAWNPETLEELFEPLVKMMNSV